MKLLGNKNVIDIIVSNNTRSKLFKACTELLKIYLNLFLKFSSSLALINLIKILDNNGAEIRLS